MLTYAVILFAIAALGGGVLALHVLRDDLAPWGLSIVHALLGAAGLVLLLVAVTNGLGSTPATWALVLFAIAAVGGFVLASFHFRGKLPHKAVVVVHAAVAVVAFGLLLSALFAV